VTSLEDSAKKSTYGAEFADLREPYLIQFNQNLLNRFRYVLGKKEKCTCFSFVSYA